MTEREWSKLCRNINEKKCILMIGPEFPITLTRDGQPVQTTIAELLFKKVGAEIVQFRRLPPNYDRSFNQKDLCQLARDYIIYNDNNQVTSREDLELLISELFDELGPHITSGSFTALADLPFYFIVDTNYGNTFHDLLRGLGKEPKKDYYNFKGAQVPISNVQARGAKIGNERQPFVYNLYGSANNSRSMAISDYDLILLLNNIISKTPGLPADVRAELTHEDTSILFMGFGMLSKNWYFRILLHALTAGNKKTMSYALDYLANIDYDADPTVLFFKDELNVCLYNYDPTTFINDLVTRYNARQPQPDDGNKVPAARPAGTISDLKVFISYKREDMDMVQKLVQRMESNYISVLWDQSNDFTGDFAQKIENMIERSDAFILMQSRSLKESDTSYVNIEIRLAMEKARTYTRMDSYLYPAYIDSKDSMLTDADFDDFVKKIQNRDLSSVEYMDNMCKEIIRNKERNKKNNIN